MAKCGNCETPITCGCQRAIATDGTHVCTKCKAAYEQKLILSRPKSNAPTNIRVVSTPNVVLKPKT